MFKFKILPIVVGLPLLVSSCARKPGKYDLTGVWESKCTENMSEGDIVLGAKERNFTEQTTYFADGRFESQLDIKYFFKDSILYSGIYKVNREEVQQTTTDTNNSFFFRDLPSTDTIKLDWIDANTTKLSDGGIQCTSIRVATN
ncbi:MAG: hypothetical protein WBM86_09055 [Waterburya sp.]